ncbi:MAG: hypothetical protein GXP27_19185 [Planctomycetes bacterium]|nr:hypothetical protein [Planctomycetota bacterium]
MRDYQWRACRLIEAVVGCSPLAADALADMLTEEELHRVADSTSDAEVEAILRQATDRRRKEFSERLKKFYQETTDGDKR